jgi:membrane-associated phospholipid phosphatase
MPRAIALTTLAFAGFTALVLLGGMNGIDDWAIDHVMPALHPHGQGNGIVSTIGLWRPFPLGIPWWQQALDAYNYPASVLISGLAIVALAYVLERRKHRVAALVWIAAWCVANAVELFGKYVIARPAVYWSNGPGRIHITPYDHSYPSGHTLRAAVLAGMLAYALPRLRFVAAAWFTLVPVTLVVNADHTISDVAGGFLLGLLLLLLTHAMIRRWMPSTSYSSASSEASSAIRSRFSRTSRAATSSSPPRS